VNRVQLEVIAPILGGEGLCAGCELVLSEAGVGGSPAGRASEDYPADWQADYRRLLEWVNALATRYGDRLTINVIDPRSAAGLGKSLRYRVRNYPTFVVGGRARIVGWQRESLEAALDAALTATMPVRGELDGRTEPGMD
jgi:hypothetical protein